MMRLDFSWMGIECGVSYGLYSIHQSFPSLCVLILEHCRPFPLKSPSTVDGCFPEDCSKSRHSHEVFLSLIPLINRTNSSKSSLFIITGDTSFVKLIFIGVLEMGYRSLFQNVQATPEIGKRNTN